MKYIINIIIAFSFTIIYTIIQSIVFYFYKNILGLIISSIFMLIIIKLFLLIKEHRYLHEYIHIKKITKKELITSVFLSISCILLAFITSNIILKIFPEVISGAKKISNIIESNNLKVNILVVVITAPIIEELIYRLITFNILKKTFSIKISIIIQAIFFSLLHANLYQFGYTFVLGIILGILMAKTNNIILPILTHSLNNLISLLFSLNIIPTYIFLFLIIIGIIGLKLLYNLKYKKI